MFVSPLYSDLLPTEGSGYGMAILRKIVEKKRNDYLRQLIESGTFVQWKASKDYTLTEIEEAYKKWKAGH